MATTELTKVLEGMYREYAHRFAQLPDKPEETLEATVRALWLRAAGIPVSAERAMRMELPILTGEQLEHLRVLMERRVGGMPLAHLIGRQSFMGLEFICSRHALIPRKETELLAAAAIELLKQQILPAVQRPRVLDLCCGSGNVACAIACAVPAARLVATDLSPEAVGLAKENARALGCGTGMQFLVGDLFGALATEGQVERFDLVTCNPPYICTGKLGSMAAEIIGHEPALAFDGGPLGVRVLWRLMQDAPRFLEPGAWLLFEVGLGQGPKLLERLKASEVYRNVRAVLDEAGNPRVMVAQAGMNGTSERQC